MEELRLGSIAGLGTERSDFRFFYVARPCSSWSVPSLPSVLFGMQVAD